MATKLAPTTASKTSTAKAPTKKSSTSKTTASKKTKVKVKFDCGFQNKLFIRGEGASLNWEKGTPLKNVSCDEWEWETSQSFNELKFKVLINDTQYENGPDHCIKQGTSRTFVPNF